MPFDRLLSRPTFVPLWNSRARVKNEGRSYVVQSKFVLQKNKFSVTNHGTYLKSLKNLQCPTYICQCNWINLFIFYYSDHSWAKFKIILNSEKTRRKIVLFSCKNSVKTQFLGVAEFPRNFLISKILPKHNFWE